MAHAPLRVIAVIRLKDADRRPTHASERVAVAIALVLEELVIDEE
jgi:hypothetical protein